VQVVGMAGFLSSQTTRELKLSCGLTLVFRKQTLSDYTANEDQVVRNRGSIQIMVNDLVDKLSEVKDKAVREKLLEGIVAAVKELALRPGFAFFDEMVDWSMSPRGKAYTLWFCTRKDTPEMKDAGDAYLLLESTLTEKDRNEIENLLNWASELDLIKNSDSPPASPEELPGTENTSDGASISEN
jgi:hypothetical protein